MEYSVLMTVYRGDEPEYLRQSLLSMIRQTKRPDEIILVKDGPVPDSIQIVINDLNRKNEEIIKEVQLEKNVGLGLALNAGIKACRNELIARMDADDISVPVRCEKQVKEFENNKYLDIVGCPVLEFEGSIKNIIGKRNVPLTNKDIYKFAKKRDPFNHPSVMYKKSKLMTVGGYGNYRKNQDTDLWIKLLSNNAICKNINEYLLYFRFDNTTYQKRKNWINTRLLLQIRYKSWKSGFCSIWDLATVVAGQCLTFILPPKIQKIIYKNLRKY